MRRLSDAQILLTQRILPNMLALILSSCEKLVDLNFGDTFPSRMCLTPVFFLISEQFYSSTLTKLKINVDVFADCLLLLDGRLDCLLTLIINVSCIFDPIIDIGQSVSMISILMFSDREKRLTTSRLISLVNFDFCF